MERRVRKTLIQILHDDLGFEENQITIDQGWGVSIGIEIDDVLGKIGRIDIFYVGLDTFFMPDETNLVAVMTDWRAVQRHQTITVKV